MKRLAGAALPALVVLACNGSSTSGTTPPPAGCDASGTCASGGDDGGGTTQDSGTPYTHPDAGAPCTASTDCAAGLDCAYPIADGCSAKGTCIYALVVGDAGSGCTTTVTCGCDGQTHRFLCYPTGYALTPTVAMGECDGGSGGGDAGQDAASDAQGDASDAATD